MVDKRLRNTWIACLLLLAGGFQAMHAFAANEKAGAPAAPSTATDALVQKGLTIAEIDRELGRLKSEDAGIAIQIARNMASLSAQDKLAADKRKQAGHVLRSYYMGERDSIWLLLFSMNSFQDALRTFDYLNMIISSDHRKLSEYTKAMNDLKQLQQGLTESQAKLKQTQNDYLAQRDRLIKLQEELDSGLAGNTEAQTVMNRIQEVTATWQQRGIPLFRTYFQALAEAMKGLPELAAKTSDGKNQLVLEGLNASFAITDTELNEFLRGKNPLFRDLSFHFVKDGVIADGKSSDLSLAIAGAYELDKEKKIIAFHVKKLTFNDFELPDTTVRDLERQVDLSFNPKAVVSFLEPVEVKQEDGKLTVRMKINF